MRLRELREDRDIPQKAVAAFLNVRQSTYSQYEGGQRQIPIILLMRLSEFYNTSVDYILGMTDEKLPYPRGNRRAYPFNEK
ncbi:MAG: helix-turn-helix transcriptional regulator [Oscillospiraceae bacterium]|nr:helix-turn-helix transcriptional regulator [Oscillospiraceae bacterium]